MKSDFFLSPLAGLGPIGRVEPTACAVGFMLSPLRGFEIHRRFAPGRTKPSAPTQELVSYIALGEQGAVAGDFVLESCGQEVNIRGGDVDRHPFQERDAAAADYAAADLDQ